MISYYILEKEGCRPIIIADRFNWWCFFFGMFWAVYKNIWSLFSLLFAIFLISTFLISKDFVDIIYLEAFRVFVALSIGFSANDLYKRKLIKQGYKLAEIKVAQNSDSALIRYLDKKIITNYH